MERYEGMPVVIEAWTDQGSHFEWYMEHYKSIDTLANTIRLIRENAPNVVRVRIDIALPPVGDIP